MRLNKKTCKSEVEWLQKRRGRQRGGEIKFMYKEEIGMCWIEEQIWEQQFGHCC